MPLNGCVVGIEKWPSNTIDWIFVRDAPQLCYTGTILHRYYFNENDAQSLIKLGNMTNVGIGYSGRSRPYDSRYSRWMQNCDERGYFYSRGAKMHGSNHDFEKYSYDKDCMCIYLYSKNGWTFKSLENSHPDYAKSYLLSDILIKNKLVDPIEDLIHTAKAKLI